MQTNAAESVPSLPCRVDCLYLVRDEAPMNIQLPAHMDKPSFLAWLQGREGRYELVDGRVVMMVNATRAHGMIVSNLVVLLRNQLDPNIWAVIADFGLDAGSKTLRFPDVVVDRAGGKPTDHTAIAPSLLIEVLSPSTARFDLGDKASEFLRVPTLAAYVVLAQDERKAWVWIRDGANFPSGPGVIDDGNAVIHIDALKLALPFGAIYAGIDLD
jgi:Uma2 family endonuclease